MNIPNYVNAPMTDKDGNITEEWSNVLQQLLSELRLNAGQEGLKASPLSTANISELIAIAALPPVDENKAVSNGSMVFDTTLNNINSPRIIIDGVLYQFNLTAV